MPMAAPPPPLTHDEPIEPPALPPTSDSAARSSTTRPSAETDEHLRSFTVSSSPSRTISPTPEEKGVEGPRESEHPIWEKDPANPLNWPIRRKWIAALAVSMAGFMSTMASSMPAPAAKLIGHHFDGDQSNRRVEILITSSYVLGLGFGPFLFAPIAELYGRKSSYTLSTIPFALINAACIIAPNMYSLIILRFFAGVFGSSGPSLGIATVSDCFSLAERGKPISIYAIGPMLGPTLGSMVGGWLTLVSFRWDFGVLAMISALNALLMLLLLQETYAPVVKCILAYERLASGTPSKYGSYAWIVALFHEADWKPVFKRAFTRPPRILFGNPVAALFASYYAYIYGIIYVHIITIPMLFNRDVAQPPLANYLWSPAIAPLGYLGLGSGFLLSAYTAASVQNRIYAYLCERNGDKGQPEYRLVLTQIGMVFFPIGWLVYGWCAQCQTHWIGPQFGLALCAYGLMLAFNSVQTFIIDFSAPYAAAGIAGATFARSVIACVLPIFAPDIFHAIGWGRGGTVFACLSLFALPAPALMFLFGKRLRERFPVQA